MKNTASKEVNDSLPRIGPLSGQIPDGDLYPLRKITVDYDVADIRRRYLKLYTPVISDTLDHMGLGFHCLNKGIYPLTHTMKVAGPAHTYLAIATSSREDRVAKIAFKHIESMIPGCVAIRATQGDVCSGQFGEITATAMAAAGCVGVVIDGSTRDSCLLIDRGFPVFCRYRHPLESKGRLMTVDYQIPVYVQGAEGKLLINPGDYIFGDNDGVVVVPKDLTVTVLEKAEAAAGQEEKTRDAVAAGESPLEVFRKFGRF